MRECYLPRSTTAPSTRARHPGQTPPSSPCARMILAIRPAGRRFLRRHLAATHAVSRSKVAQTRRPNAKHIRQNARTAHAAPATVAHTCAVAKAAAANLSSNMQSPPGNKKNACTKHRVCDTWHRHQGTGTRTRYQPPTLSGRGGSTRSAARREYWAGASAPSPACRPDNRAISCLSQFYHTLRYFATVISPLSWIPSIIIQYYKSDFMYSVVSRTQAAP